MDVESDSGAWQAHQAQARNYVKFYPKWKRNNFQSEKEGIEVGEHKDYVMIICPGQPKSEVHQEVREEHRAEYPTEWAAYKAGKEQRLNGTPIEQLPGLDQSRADSMKAIYIHTIEQLAEASEPAMRGIGMGAVDLKNKAKAYLSKNTAQVVELQQALAKRDELIADLKGSVDTLRTQVEQLAAAQMPAPARRVHRKKEQATN